MIYDNSKIIKQYDTACETFKQGWQAGLWPSWKVQQQVYGAMLDFGRPYSTNLTPPVNSLLDVGCGQGDLIEFLKDNYFQYDYTGLDISPKMIERAREKHPDKTFLLQDVMDHEGSYDYVIATGTFNMKVENHMAYTRAHLGKLFSLCKKAVSVFFLSKLLWESYYEDLYYHDPADLIKECAEVSPLFTLDHCNLPGLILLRLYR